MKCKYVLFDFDGTIADTEKMAFYIYQKLSQEYRLKKIEEQDLHWVKNMSASELIDYVELKKSKIPFVLKKAKRILRQEISHVKPCKTNIVQVLRELKQERNIKLGIVTTNSRKNVETFLLQNNMDFFDIILSSSLLGKESKLKKALQKMGLQHDEVLYVGDEIRDIQAAKSLDIRIVSVTWGYNSPESLRQQQPDYLIEEFDDLLKIC